MTFSERINRKKGFLLSDVVIYNSEKFKNFVKKQKIRVYIYCGYILYRYIFLRNV